jgi:hypothetical protein
VEKSLLLLKVIAWGLKRAFIDTNSYRSGNILTVIASKSYCTKN